MLKKILCLGLISISLVCAKDKSSQIVKIPEASGIDYCTNSDTLVVANDEGWYYEISTDGEILDKQKAKKYDLEGVVCEDDYFIFAVEDKGLLKINRKTNKMKLLSFNTKYKQKNIELFDKKAGIEGIAKVGDIYYLSKQSKKKKGSFIVGVKIHNNRVNIVEIIKHKVADTSGLTYYKKSLYMVSDKNDIAIEYNLKKKKIIKKIDLPKSAQEGITFDKEGFFYIADDDGRVLKYNQKMLYD